MSLRLYLDDCVYSKQLTAKLRAAGHDVLTPVEAGTLGLPDAEHLRCAIADNRALLTHNCGDFEELHAQLHNHPGIIAIYQDNDSRRDMTYDQIVKALENFTSAGIDLRNEFHVLNVWR